MAVDDTLTRRTATARATADQVELDGPDFSGLQKHRVTE